MTEPSPDDVRKAREMLTRMAMTQPSFDASVATWARAFAQAREEGRREGLAQAEWAADRHVIDPEEAWSRAAGTIADEIRALMQRSTPDSPPPSPP